MKKNTVIRFAVLLFLSTSLIACGNKKENNNNITDQNKPWSVKLAESEIKRFPEAWMIEKAKSPRWGYTHGCVAKAMLDLYNHTHDSTFYKYSKGYADILITAEGSIKTYQFEKFNIDNINAGKILFRFYSDTKNNKYKLAIDTLVLQMENQPRTKVGGYWHKKIYPDQMWLDGVYMAEPFLAEYAAQFNKPEMFDDIVKQFTLIDKYCYDKESGLYYHGWDESRKQKWADPKTGLSPNFWSRSIGWYALASVDVLDYLPQDHAGRKDILNIIDKLAKGITKWQDQKSGTWYQVTNLGDRKGNYLESSGSAMFVAFLYKAIRKGYISSEYLAPANKGFEGLIKEFTKLETDGTYTITNCCAVAGLGGEKVYRDGSFEYYIGEPVIENDPKSVAPFIWAAIENEKQKKQK